MAPLTLTALVLAVLATLVGVVVLGRGVWAIVRTVRRGGPAGRTDRPGLRTWTVVRTVVGHGRFRQRPAVRVAHWLVMVSFPVLFLTLVAGYGQIVDPGFALPLVGHWAPWEWLTEALAWTSLVGILALIAVRLRTQPVAPGAGAEAAATEARRSRFFGSNRGQAYFVEAVVLVVVLAVLALRAFEHAWLAADPATAHLATPVHFPGTAWLGALLADVPAATLATAITLTALVKILASMTWMVVVGLRPAMGVSWHRFLAFVTIWARREPDGAAALGPLPPVRAAGKEVDFADLESLPEDARLGVGRIEDFTWKGLLDFSTCTECGRCQEQCPAWNTGKPLSPKLVVMALRDHAYASAPYLRAAANAPTAPAGLTDATGHVPWGPTPVIASLGTAPAGGTGAGDASAAGGDRRGAAGGVGPGGGGVAGGGGHGGLDALALVGGVVEEDALWDCTMCGACVAQCPVDIEHVDHIADLRRHQVLMESAFPAELGGMFTKLERQGNPWGVPARKRLEWAKGLDFPVPVVGVDVESAAEVDYLFWVGCAGAFEDRAKETSRAVAELLHTAGVSFAVLGDGESCTGDPARRAGNEMLYQMLAAANVEALDAAGARRIVVTCAHCFNTLSREYPQVGGRYEVVHHTELLESLVAEGRLVPLTPVASEPVTYHDPCFLGRHNEIYLPPRALLGAAGATTVEMPRTGERALCCGGGGARVWMEEARGTRIATDRATEALGTGAGRIVTACPFCTVMLTDGVAAAGGSAEVVDVATVLLDAVRGGAGGAGGGVDEGTGAAQA